jgi:CRP-like cAMP-binding protein
MMAQISRPTGLRSRLPDKANSVINRTFHAGRDAVISAPTFNRLLAALPTNGWPHGSMELQLLNLPLGKVLARAGEEPSYAYFPTTAIVSLQQILESGSNTEVAAVGNDGVVGVSVFMGGGSTLLQAAVRCAGQGFRVNADAMRHMFEHSAAPKGALLLYAQALITQMAQTVVCNRHHCIVQQLCRFLLCTLDRSAETELRMTQELIANALGVRREGVTQAAVMLKKAELLEYGRGYMRIRDRKGLEDRVCECYSAVANESSRLLRVRR